MIQEALSITFQDMEREWHAPGIGAGAATEASIERLNRGETIIFVYPWANPGKVDEVMENTKSAGQFDLGLYGDSRLHVTKYIKKPGS